MYRPYVPEGRDTVIEVAPKIIGIDPKVAIWLFGSWARGRPNALSDVDALVVVSDRMQVQEARQVCIEAGLTPIVTDPAQLCNLPKKSPLLALHLSTEAVKVVGTGSLPRPLWRDDQRAAASRRALSRLEAARHEVSVWGADDKSAQTMVFGAVKEWAMLTAALSGRPEFDRRLALRRLAESGAHEKALAELEAVWLAKRARTRPPVLSDPELVVSQALDLAPAASRA
jgi:predicted nucleotidyltransferase